MGGKQKNIAHMVPIRKHRLAKLFFIFFIQNRFKRQNKRSFKHNNTGVKTEHTKKRLQRRLNSAVMVKILLINSQFNSTQLKFVKSDNDYWFIHPK